MGVLIELLSSSGYLGSAHVLNPTCLLLFCPFVNISNTVLCAIAGNAAVFMYFGYFLLPAALSAFRTFSLVSEQ